MKKLSLLLLTLLSIHTIFSNDLPPITLEAEILEIVDGRSLGVNGNTIGMIIRLRLDLQKRRFGKTSAGPMTFYTFENKGYTLQALIDLEEQLTRNNSTNDQGRLAKLHIYLEEIKDEFIELVKPFLADARGAKNQMVILISEWAQKSRRPNSQLLVWARLPEGDETHSVYKELKSLKAFDRFCEDLGYFLETLLRSCPKACAQFKAMMEQKQKEQHAHKG